MRSLILISLLGLALASHTLGDALDPLPPASWNEAAAAHLLRRAGFGGSPAQAQRLAAMPLAQAVAELVDYRDQPAMPRLDLDPPSLDGTQLDREIVSRIAFHRDRILGYQRQQLLQAGQDPQRAMVDPMKRQRQMQAEAQAVNEVFNKYDRQRLSQLRSGWLLRMLHSRRPLEEKLTLFWHGHFTSAYESVNSADLMRRQNELFREQATDFPRLLRLIIRDPAMLRYLDGFRNIKQNPNENFAREFLELFTLGRGHYTEKDIREAARALTGWQLSGSSVSYNRYLHDYGEKTFLGRTGRHGAEEIVQIVLAQKQTSRWLAARLARFFVADDPQPALVEGLASALRASNYQLRPALTALFCSAAFYAPDVVGNQIKSPVQLVVETIRTIGLPDATVASAEPLMAQMGQVLFQPPNVKGWDGGRSWINASTLLSRYNVVSSLIGQARWVANNEQARARWRAALPKALRKAARVSTWQQGELLFLPVLRRFTTPRKAPELLDEMLALLLAKPIQGKRRAQLLAVLAPRGGELDPGAFAVRRRMLATLQLILGLPEYQLG